MITANVLSGFVNVIAEPLRPSQVVNSFRVKLAHAVVGKKNEPVPPVSAMVKRLTGALLQNIAPMVVRNADATTQTTIILDITAVGAFNFDFIPLTSFWLRWDGAPLQNILLIVSTTMVTTRKEIFVGLQKVSKLGIAVAHYINKMALHEIDQDLRTAEMTLSHWSIKFPDLIRSEANAKVSFEIAWADAVKDITDKAQASGEKQPTVAVLEAEATRICAEAIKAKRLAEAEAEIAKKLIGIAETTLTSVQSRLKLAQIEQGLNGQRT